MPRVVPAAHHLDRAGIRLGRFDVLVGVRLAHGRDQLVLLEPGYPPLALLVVGKRNAEAGLGDLVEQVPVVMERGVDVEGDL